jgi:hypothetical protein
MLDISQRRYQVLGTAWLAWFVNYIDRTKTAAQLWPGPPQWPGHS